MVLSCSSSSLTRRVVVSPQMVHDPSAVTVLPQHTPEQLAMWLPGIMQVATHLATVTRVPLHTVDAEPLYVGLYAGSLHAGSQLLHACKGAGRAVLPMGEGQGVR